MDTYYDTFTPVVERPPVVQQQQPPQQQPVFSQTTYNPTIPIPSNDDYEYESEFEYNETPEEAALREVYEESGIKVKLIGERFPREDDYIRPLGIQCNRKDGYTQVDILYFGIPIGDTTPVVTNDHETISARWFSIEELEELNVFEDIKITYDYIIRNIFKK